MRPLFQQTLTPFWTPHQVRSDIVHIGVRGDTICCSFFSTARRTNQEAPPLLSGFIVRRLAPPSGAVELAASDSPRPHTSVGWPPPDPIKAGFITAMEGARHTALRRGIQEYWQEYLQKSDSSVLRWTPHQVRGDTVRIEVRVTSCASERRVAQRLHRIQRGSPSLQRKCSLPQKNIPKYLVYIINRFIFVLLVILERETI